jgi:CheY-like chemotaxis protein
MTAPGTTENLRPLGILILVVDDDRTYREAVGRMLERTGYAVAGAANGEEALGLLQAAGAVEPDLIVLDLRMPVMSGWELMKTLDADAQRRHIPILVASASRPELNAGANVGPRVWLPKPMDPDLLLSTVRTLVRHVG